MLQGCAKWGWPGTCVSGANSIAARASKIVTPWGLLGTSCINGPCSGIGRGLVDATELVEDATETMSCPESRSIWSETDGAAEGATEFTCGPGLM